MALLVWDDVTWPVFVAGLEGFRDHFTESADSAYFRFFEGPNGAIEIVTLLNKWACRLSSERAPGALAEWLAEKAAALQELEPLTIADPRVPARAEELGSLHDDLIAHMRAGGVHSMGDAAASKALHLLHPRLFVMWDKEIRRSAREGYGDYLLEMHGLGRRLTDEAPAEDVEAYLRELLGYETKKTLAKYLDEYNWFEAVGREQLTARRGRFRAAPG